MGLGAAVAAVTFVVLFAGILLANRLTGERDAVEPAEGEAL